MRCAPLSVRTGVWNLQTTLLAFVTGGYDWSKHTAITEGGREETLIIQGIEGHMAGWLDQHSPADWDPYPELTCLGLSREQHPELLNMTIRHAPPLPDQNPVFVIHGQMKAADWLQTQLRCTVSTKLQDVYTFETPPCCVCVSRPRRVGH